MSEQVDVSTLPGAIPLSVENIGPMKGRHDLGHVPYGLTAVEASNEGGKSRLFSALLAMQLPKLEPGQVSVADGEAVAKIGFGAAGLTVTERVGTGGKIRVAADRQRVAAEGAIIEMPDPIEVLVDADHVDGEDAARRRRVQAVARWVKAEVTEEALRFLAGPPLDPPHNDLAETFLEAHALRPYPTLVDALDAYAGPRGELNRRAKAVEDEAAAAELVVAERHGQLKGVIEAAKERLHLSDDPDLVEQALAACDVQPAKAAVAFSSAQSKLSGATASRAAAQAEQERREKLRAAHGERPVVPLGELEAATARLTEAQRAVDEARAALAKAETALAGATSGWAAAEREVRTAQMAAAGWDAVERQLAEPVPGAPTDEEIAELHAACSAAERATDLAECAASYRHASAEALSAEERHGNLLAVAKSLRAAKAGALDRLGALLNEKLPPNIVRIGPGTGEPEIMVDDGTWYAAIDTERVSKGRLRQAALELFLALAEPGQTVLISEEIMLPIDDVRRAKISKLAAERKLRLLFEQPVGGVSLPRLHFYGWEGMVAA